MVAKNCARSHHERKHSREDGGNDGRERDVTGDRLVGFGGELDRLLPAVVDANRGLSWNLDGSEVADGAGAAVGGVESASGC